MRVRFWGVRGSIPVAGPEYVRTGGNTSCLEFEHDGARLVIDGGTGLRALGDQMGFAPVDLTLLFTHTHWDHIQGVPFFTPAYHPGSRITFTGPSPDGVALREVLSSQMRPPTFPIRLDDLAAQLHFKPLPDDGVLEIGPFRVTWVQLNHPDGVRAYRIETDAGAIVHATDVEHGDSVDDRLVAFAEGASLLIHDAQYTAAEYRGEGGPSRRGWGHATWQDAVEVARRAAVGRLALFHHDPRRPDLGVAALEREARALFANAFAAREDGPIGL